MRTVETEDDSGILGPEPFPQPFSHPGLTGRPEAVLAGLDRCPCPVPVVTVQVGGEERTE